MIFCLQDASEDREQTNRYDTGIHIIAERQN
jgi:hypothetical protein